MRGDNKGIRYLRAHLDVSSSVGLLASGLPLQDGLPVGVELQVGDDDVGRVDTDLDGGTVGLVGGDSLNVDDPLLSVDLDDLALLALVLASDNQDLVVLSDGHGSDRVLLPQLLVQPGAHDLPLDRGRSGEVGLSALASVVSDGGHLERSMLPVF